MNYANSPDDLQYTGEIIDSQIKAINKPSTANQLISNLSAFNASAMNAPSSKADQNLLKLKFIPFFSSVLENKFRLKLSQAAFRDVKHKYWIEPFKIKKLASLEGTIKKASSRFVFQWMSSVQEHDSMISEKMKEFYRISLKRIFFATLKDFKNFQAAWIH